MLNAINIVNRSEQIGRSFVTSKLKDYPQFRAVAIAIQRSGFKVCISISYEIFRLSVLVFDYVEFLLSHLTSFLVFIISM